MSEHAESYEAVRPAYETLARRVCEVVAQLGNSEPAAWVAATSFRAKDPASFVSKIERKGYENPLTDMEDLAGVRAVVYRRSDIALLDGRISDRFYVRGGTDKSAALGSSSMGYGGVHLVVSLDPNKDPHPVELSGLKCEVQIRTILQDAWSVFSHKLAYKSTAHIPLPLRRRFNALSALLELADMNFEDVLEAQYRSARVLALAPLDSELFLASGVDHDSVTALSLKLFPDLAISPHWQDRLIEDVHAGSSIKTIGQIADAVERSRGALEAYRRKRPDIFKYSTDFLTKALGFTDADFRARHPFGPRTLAEFRDYPVV